VVRVRPPALDPFGDPLPGSPSELTIRGCRFAPGPSRELGVGISQVDTDATVYAPAGVDVLATDLIRARGQLYTVVGQPQDWGSAGVVVVLRRFA
jgi:hypothetical protein